MIPKQDYKAILTNLTSQKPLDLDAAIFDASKVCDIVELDTATVPSNSVLWQFSDPSRSHIGFRVKSPIKNPDLIAARLASIALERRVFPVFLSYIADCGMQHFGFRVEQLSGLSTDTQLQFEQQLAVFWNFALVVDAAEITNLR
ncbi:MAG: hypothetical protein WBV62_18685 [Roseobacter sp.]